MYDLQFITFWSYYACLLFTWVTRLESQINTNIKNRILTPSNTDVELDGESAIKDICSEPGVKIMTLKGE